MTFFASKEAPFEASWTALHVSLIMDSAIRSARWFVNRPGITELRLADQEGGALRGFEWLEIMSPQDFYTVLTVQSCRRGLPLLPWSPKLPEPEHLVP